MSRNAKFLGFSVFAIVLFIAVLLVAGVTGLTWAAAGPAARPAAVGAAGPPSSSFRFAKNGIDRPEAEPAAPIGLTASDGTGLALVAVEANGVLEPPLAFTELHLTFENPGDQRIEGRFRIALPPGAALSRFAMKNDSGWQEGEVVERRRAQVVYEDFLHLRQDPALLEQEAGNEFSARVFPIPARGRKELIVSYSHALERADQPYVLPLRGLSRIGRLDLRVLLGGRPATGAASNAPASNLGGEVSDRRVVELHKRDWTPDRDFEIAQDRVEGSGGRAGLRQGNLAVVRVSAPVEAVPQEIAGLYVLVDSSASRALGYATQVRRLQQLIAGLRDGGRGSIPLGIAAFDQEVAPVYEGTAGGFGGAELQQLAGRRPLGASDLAGALGWLADRLPRHGRKYPRVLLVTDGVATAGNVETRVLRAAVHALGTRGVERLDVLAVGGLRDEAVLHELTTGNLAHDGQRLDGAAPLAEIARRLSLACRSGIKVAVDGAAWIWPETLDGVQAGDQALVYADLPADRPLRLTLDGRPALLGGEPASTERPLLERAWAQARIERLLHLRESALGSDDDLRKALGLEIVEVSVKHRVLSPFTAMLVLESAYDYQRFGLDQRSLADILTVGPGGLDVLARRSPDLTRQAQAVESPKPVDPGPGPDSGAVEAPGDLSETITVRAESPLLDTRVVAGGVAGGVVGGVSAGISGGTPQPLAPPPSVESQADLVVPGERPALGERRISTGATVTDEELRRIPTVQHPSAQPIRDRNPVEEKAAQSSPWTGRFAEVKAHLAAGRVGQARALAEAWNTEAPGDVLALLALGEAWEAAGERTAAARAYGSLIDLFPSRVDLRRLAGERLERLGDAGLELAIDTYRKAVEQRPDHPSGHRLLAWALLRAGRFEAAFQALERGIEQQYPGGRFLGVDRVLREDLGLLAAAWLRAEPARRGEVLDHLQAHGAQISTEPTLRFVLTWETDANDVDLHVYDRRGAHAFYGQKTLSSGGELYADVTTGYGPECFTVPAPSTRDAAPYRLAAHYYSRGPMGYGMGTVQVVRHDGAGRLTVEPRPFVVMNDQAMVDLGTVGGGKVSGKAGR
jgi:hypothetical protein